MRTQFILDAIADAREVTVDNDDLSAQIMAQAQRSRMSPEQYAQQLQQGGNIAEFVADVRRTKTLAQLLEETTITDASGNVVDLEALRPADDPAPRAEAADEAADAGTRPPRRPPTRPPPRRPRTRRRPDRLTGHVDDAVPPDPGWGGVVVVPGRTVPLRRRRTPPRRGLRRRRSALGSTGLRRSPGGTASRSAVPGPHHRSHPPTETDCIRQSYGGHRTREHPRPEPRRARR